MDQNLAEAVGLLRHQIISPMLMESGRSQMEYFRSLEGKDFDVPGRGLKRFRATTMKGWLNRYKKNGFTALIPKGRNDLGSYRRWSAEARDKVREFRKRNLKVSVVKFYDLCVQGDLFGTQRVCLATLRRFLKNENLFEPSIPMVARKRFEMSRFGEMWTADFMHGPSVFPNLESRKRRVAILMAIIDDHSRMIVGAEFGFTETTLLLEKVFKESLLQFGLPLKLYVDNGPSFSSQYLARVCANLGMGLIHSKPYDSASRGKIERFFRSVRESFLRGKDFENKDLKTLNEEFQIWLRNDYHHKHHKGIDMRPIDRWQSSVIQYPLKRVSEEVLEEFFLVSVERTVNKDATLRLDGGLFEAPSDTIGKRVELRYTQENPNDVYLYENGIRRTKLHPLDAYANAKEYRPSNRDPHISLQGVMKND